mmetsp:Transcript_18187/g.36911  ORF Transcript_18187/g.36911 Transcript_18187/m.36911 type:complete len:229 (-) Transcript_18187:323-1009(-)
MARTLPTTASILANRRETRESFVSTWSWTSANSSWRNPSNNGRKSRRTMASVRTSQMDSSQQSMRVWASLDRTSTTGSSASPGRIGAMWVVKRSGPPSWVIRATFSTAAARTSASWSWRSPEKQEKSSVRRAANLGLEPKPREPATVANSLERLWRTRQLRSVQPAFTTGNTISTVNSGSIPSAQPTLPPWAHANNLTLSCSSVPSARNTGTISSLTTLRTSDPAGLA